MLCLGKKWSQWYRSCARVRKKTLRPNRFGQILTSSTPPPHKIVLTTYQDGYRKERKSEKRTSGGDWRWHK